MLTTVGLCSRLYSGNPGIDGKYMHPWFQYGCRWRALTPGETKLHFGRATDFIESVNEVEPVGAGADCWIGAKNADGPWSWAGRVGCTAKKPNKLVELNRIYDLYHVPILQHIEVSMGFIRILEPASGEVGAQVG